MGKITCAICGSANEHLLDCPFHEVYNKMDPAPMGLSRQKAADLLQHASELINGERAKDYGEPQQSFEKIAKLWSTYLHHEITVTDVGMLMILLKVARNGRGRNKPDNFVDICGYASLVGSEFFEAKDKKE